MLPLPHIVAVLTPGAAADPYSGGTRADWTTATSRPVWAWVQERSTADLPGVDRAKAATSTQVTMFTVDAVQAAERVVWVGRTFEVDGHPAAKDTPAGVHHWETQLREVVG